MPPCTPSPALLPSSQMPAEVQVFQTETKEASTQNSQAIREAKLKTAHLVRCGSILSNTNLAGQFHLGQDIIFYEGI